MKATSNPLTAGMGRKLPFVRFSPNAHIALMTLIALSRRLARSKRENELCLELPNVRRV